MKIISVANQKGGVGKTTTVLNAGAGIAKLGFRVLLIDLDPQAHLTTSLGLNPDKLPASIYQVFENRSADMYRLIMRVGEGVYVLPSSLELSLTEMKLYGETGRDFILKHALERCHEIDYVIIDCPPNLGLLTVNAFAASDYLIVPVQTEYLATRGFAALLGTLEVVKERLNPKIELLGVLATMYDSRKVLDREIVESIRESFGKELFDTRIRSNVSLAEAPSHGKSIFEYKSDSAGAADYEALSKEIITRTGEKDHG